MTTPATLTQTGTSRVLEKRRRDGWYYPPKGVSQEVADYVGVFTRDRYASVTEILGIIAKPQLTHWAARTAAGLVLSDPEKYDTAEKAASGIYHARDRAADRGSFVHSLIERYSRGESAELAPGDPEDWFGYVTAFKGFIEATHPEIVHTEANVYSDQHGYAGTMDSVARIGSALWLLDWKTTRDIYDEVGLQLAAYRHADFILTKTDPPTVKPMPQVEKTGVVLLRDNGTWEFREVTADLEVFLAALILWRWKKGA